MSDVRFRSSPALVVSMVAVVLSLGAAAYAAIPDSGGVIHGCYQTNSGLLTPPQGTVRVVDSAQGQSCRGGETVLNWNQTGPQGPAGPVGPTGPTGPGSRPSLFIAPGDSSYTVPAGTTALFVRLWGGGGGGATGDNDAVVGGGGGGQGGYVEARIPVSAGSVYRVRVGAGGARGEGGGVTQTAGDRSSIDIGGSILATAAGGAAGHGTQVGGPRDPGACPPGGAGGSGSVAAPAQGLILITGENGARASSTRGCNGASSATDGAGGGTTGFLGAGGAGGNPGDTHGVGGSDGGVIVVTEPAGPAGS